LPRQALEVTSSIERGIKACTMALDIDATRDAAHANLGALFLLRAQREGDADGTRRVAVRAVQSLTKALEINKWLQRDYAPLLTQARALADGK
jgi:hypothetical protein